MPAALGSPWPDVSGLTISLPKDDTLVSGVKSSLARTLNAVAPTAVWQRELLRAFQTWAVQSNVNFGRVADSNLAFGSTGDLQGDTRFGDVRIGAIPLSASEGATANPYDWASGTWSGDVLLSSAAKYAVNPAAGSGALDLFTVALHEAGHVLGIDHSADPNSVMSETYAGRRTALSAGDVAALQALYGVRTADRYEGAGGNNTLATAALLSGTAITSATADITTVGDVDYFAFIQPAGTDKAKVRLYTAGVSLLVGQVQVVDSTGRVFQSAAATDPTTGVLKIDLDHLTAGAKYYVRVASASQDVFGIGQYQLKVGFTGEPTADAKYIRDEGADNARGGATAFDTSDGGVAYNAVLEGPTDVDWYRVTAPPDSQGQVPTVSVRGIKTDGAPPALTAFDADGNPLLAQLIQNDANGYTVQVSGVSPGGTFYLRLAAPAGVDKVTDNYRLQVNFTSPQVSNLDSLEFGQLNQQLTSSGTLSLSASGLFQFYLSSGALAGIPGAALTLSVTNATGKTVFAMTASSAQPAVSGAAYLAAGSYTVKVALTIPTGTPLVNVGFDLLGGIGSDPIGTYQPGSTTSPPPPPPSYTYSGSSTSQPTGSAYAF